MVKENEKVLTRIIYVESN